MDRKNHYKGVNAKGIWVVGDLLHENQKSIITYVKDGRKIREEVKKDSICQAVALTDSIGKPIYEYDILVDSNNRNIVLFVLWDDGNYHLASYKQQGKYYHFYDTGFFFTQQNMDLISLVSVGSLYSYPKLFLEIKKQEKKSKYLEKSTEYINSILK